MGFRLWVHRVKTSELCDLFSQCVKTNTNRYDYNTGGISPDVVEQTEQTFRNIETALSEAGATVNEIVRVKYVLPVREDFQKCWPVLRKWLGGARPAATMIVVGLLDDAMKIEIEATARKGSAYKEYGDVLASQ